MYLSLGKIGRKASANDEYITYQQFNPEISNLNILSQIKCDIKIILYLWYK